MGIQSFFRGRSVLFWLVMLFVVLPVFPALLGSMGFLLYIYWPIDLSKVQLPEVSPGTRHVIVISHGLKDSSGSWPLALKAALAGRDEHTQIVAMDWNPFSQNASRCSVDGQRIGQLIGDHLARQPAIRSVHFIGHSCGAFINLGGCRAVKASRPEISVQTTYLDAVAIYGGIVWDYGLRNFGTCADFADAYIDTGDGVPGSNQLLPATHTFDVTFDRLASDYTGSPHLWPVHFYQMHASAGTTLELTRTPDLNMIYPRGVLSPGAILLP